MTFSITLNYTLLLHLYDGYILIGYLTTIHFHFWRMFYSNPSCYWKKKSQFTFPKMLGVNIRQFVNKIITVMLFTKSITNFFRVTENISHPGCNFHYWYFLRIRKSFSVINIGLNEMFWTANHSLYSLLGGLTANYRMQCRDDRICTENT